MLKTVFQYTVGFQPLCFLFVQTHYKTSRKMQTTKKNLFYLKTRLRNSRDNEKSSGSITKTTGNKIINQHLNFVRTLQML